MNEDKTWVEINQAHILNNFKEFRKRVGKAIDIAAVVKANAYGHDIEIMAKILSKKADCFAVDSLSEALKVHKLTAKPIIILGYTSKGEYATIIKHEFEKTVFDFTELRLLQAVAEKNNKKALVHLEIETGTSRNGILIGELNRYLAFIKKSTHLKLAGVFMHYANIEDTTNHKYAEKQLQTYRQALCLVAKYGFSDFKKHTACTAASILFDKTYFDLIRLGIGLYGLWPSKETKTSEQAEKKGMNLKPALTWKTRIAHLKALPAKTCVGYGCTRKLTRNSKVAVIPVGYYDGLDRSLSNVGSVLVSGKICPILGRICMNMTMIDVTNVLRAKVGDEVVLLGAQKGRVITAEDMAQKANTINYEVITRINLKIKRIIV